MLDRVFHDSWPEQFEVLDPAYLLFTAVFDMTSRDAVASYPATSAMHNSCSPATRAASPRSAVL